MTHRQYLLTVTAGMLGLFLATGVALARDRSFAAVLEGLEHDYHLQPQSVPGLWLATSFINVMPTPGFSQIDFVLFEEKGLRELAGTRDLDRQVLGMLGSGWNPFVLVDSSANKERVLIFARPSGRRMDLFILTCEPDESVAMFVRVDPNVVKDILDHPNSPPIPGRTAQP
jgi:hypothetical protein